MFPTPLLRGECGRCLYRALGKDAQEEGGRKQGPELERYSDWIKSTLRVAVAVSKVEGVMSSHRFAEFMDRIQKDEKFMSKLQALAAEQ